MSHLPRPFLVSMLLFSEAGLDIRILGPQKDPSVPAAAHLSSLSFLRELSVSLYT